MGFFKWFFKMLLSVAFDVMDFFFGRIPVAGTMIDIVGTIVAVWLWGGPGLIQGLEILDFTDQIDGFVPSMSIAGLLRINEIWND